MEWTAATYGDRIAGIYDELYGNTVDTEGAVERLAALAGSGPVLEFGAGTGRLALPLRARGLDVHGIEASPAMIERLRARPGGAELPVVRGDMSETQVDGRFSLVFVVFNTLIALLTQEAQLRCVANAARHLLPGGLFVVEIQVPDPGRYVRNQEPAVVRVEPDRVLFDVTRINPLEQRMSVQHLHFSEQGIRMYPIEVRYIWPSELDLMARLAGFHLRERHGGWRGEPFTNASFAHVSVYELS